ncbi:hypothetical protein [Marinomonas ostreistagni]|uniref:Glycosyltransferase RgtA/B/C/D-like domain-containing protein n=1 Tax=Marinomonas ostreistagni TaxID=359209 RepID=A0ABS0Z9C1_9GAMM|nr:hypothetical protein [Marinomonas ostreistagni]MBJ7550259.1 hypothetical protein [Marinomonas ostreistagni]
MRDLYSKTEKLLFIYGFLIIAFLVSTSTKNPIYNWDIIPYIGSTLTLDSRNIEEIHSLTYKTLSSNIPEKEFEKLINDRNESINYRKSVYEKPEIFKEQLNFYFIKPFYIGSIYLLKTTGLQIIDAIYTLSILACISTSLLLLYWTNLYLNANISFIVTLLIGVQSKLFVIGRMPTPDALSVFTVLLALFFLVERKNLKATTLLLMASIFIRPNNIIITLLVLTYLTYLSHHQKNKSDFYFFILTIASSILIYFSIGKLLNRYDWWTLFHHSFIQNLNYPSKFDSSFSIDEYIAVITLQVKGLFMMAYGFPSTMIIFIFINIITFNMDKFSKDKPHTNPILILSIIIVLNYLAHLFLFPGVIQWDRFFTSFYIFSAIALISKISPNLSRT